MTREARDECRETGAAIHELNETREGSEQIERGELVGSCCRQPPGGVGGGRLAGAWLTLVDGPVGGGGTVGGGT